MNLLLNRVKWYETWIISDELFRISGPVVKIGREAWIALELIAKNRAQKAAASEWPWCFCLPKDTKMRMR